MAFAMLFLLSGRLRRIVDSHGMAQCRIRTEVKKRILAGAYFSGRDYAESIYRRANAHRAQLRVSFENADVDAWFLPTTLTLPLRSDEKVQADDPAAYHLDAVNVIANLTGCAFLGNALGRKQRWPAHIDADHGKTRFRL